MKHLFKKVTLFLTAAAIGTGLAACGSKIQKEETFPMEQIEHIVVKTTGNDVIVKQTGEDDVTASLSGYEGSLFVQEGNTLTVDIPASKGGVNLSSPEPLYIGIPCSDTASLSVTSDTGNVRIDSVVIKEISVNTQIGHISILRLYGELNAQTDFGEIEIKKGLSDEIKKEGENRYYSKILGGNATQSITLYSNMGNIKID